MYISNLNGSYALLICVVKVRRKCYDGQQSKLVLQKYPFIIKLRILFCPKIKNFLCNRLHNSNIVSTFASDC